MASIQFLSLAQPLNSGKLESSLSGRREEPSRSGVDAEKVPLKVPRRLSCALLPVRPPSARAALA